MNLKSIFVFFLAISSIQLMYSQQLMIPRASSKALISQTVGVCSISVEYGRPSVRNRAIFSKLVPYEKVWRAGANEATTITFDHPINFEGKSVAAGKYGLFMIPRKDSWTIILNKDWSQWGAYNYDSTDDVLRVNVKPTSNELTELCTYSFVGVTKIEGILRLEWETSKVDIKISTATNKHTLQDIDLVLNRAKENWYSFSAAAQYHFYELKETEKALEYIDVAIALAAPNPSPWMLKSQILASQGQYTEAIHFAEMAIDVCKEHDFSYEVHENEENILKWKMK